MRGPDSLMIKSHYNHYKHRCEVTRIFMTYVAKKKKEKRMIQTLKTTALYLLR